MGTWMPFENKVVFNKNIIEIEVIDFPGVMYILLILNQSGTLNYKLTKL